jgi:hypothetical protein
MSAARSSDVAQTKPTGMGWAAREIVERARSVVRLEIELALLEVKRKLMRIALGTGLGAGAVVVALFALGFLAAGVAAAIAIALPVWAALLIVGGVLLAVTAGLVGLAARSLRAGTPLIPEEAVEEARRTADVLRAG